jgi:3-oxoacyl-[acyl-carrier protein] reductase
VRSILITGGNGGLGLGIGRYFLEKEPDAKVWLGLRTNRSSADALAAEFPGRAALLDLEVTSKESWEAAVATILEADGRVDVLVNNAGLHRDHLLAAMPDEAWSDVISTNLDSVFLGCRAVIRPMMAQRFGRIVNISSVVGSMGNAGQCNYAASKAGLIGLTKSVAKELASRHVLANVIAPGFIQTDMTAAMTPEAQAAITGSIPLERLGTPADIAGAVAFLASPYAAYITGQVLVVDGGLVM